MPKKDWLPEESISSIINKIDSNQIFLPALQRKFVWKTKQIEQLFDSIMQGFPIGTFLFWDLKDPKIIKNFVFYKFINNYKQFESRNQKQTLSGYDEIVSVIDGQQRLTSLYIALRGSYRYKTYKKHRANKNAYPERFLYMNLMTPKSNKLKFEFKFKTQAETQKEFSDKKVWYRVSGVLDWKGKSSANEDYKRLKKESPIPDIITKNKYKIIHDLKILYHRLCVDNYVAYFILENKTLDEVLDIFIRVNNGGTVLSKTELLMSSVTANWENARIKVEDLLEYINGLGRGFKFDIDFIMRTCLVLLDEQILFKVESFNINKVDKIKENWKSIEVAITKTVQLLIDFGFDALTLTSRNSVIPIIYYVYKGGSIKKNKERNQLKKYLQLSLLTGLFGSHGDSVLENIRKSLTKVDSNGFKVLKSKLFNFSDLKKSINMPGKSLEINDEVINRIMLYKKGRQAFITLSILYPNLRYNEIEFDQDHIHPSFSFSDIKLKDINLNSSDMIRWQEMKDQLPNLQMMEGRKNRQKNKTPFNDWLNEMFNDENNIKTSKEVYLNDNYIPKGISYNIKNFETFFDKRRSILIKRLKEILDN